MVLWLLRGTLLLTVLAALSGYAVISGADVDHPTYPQPATGPARLVGPAVLLVGDGISCSATLASDITALTAGHCLTRPDGTARAHMRAHVTARAYHVPTSTADADYTCTIARTRNTGHAGGADDWAVAELAECHDQAGRYVPRVGAAAGYHPPADFTATLATHPKPATSYLGYPGTRDGRTGILQRLDADFTHRPVVLRVFRPLLARHITCADAASVPGGGSGGGVIAHTGARTRLVAVNNFLVAGSHACFRKVDAEIVAAVAVATSDWLPEHRVTRRRGR